MTPDIWTPSPDVPVVQRPPQSTQRVQRVDLGRLKSALDAIPNSGEQELDYDQWRDVVFGIHHASGGTGEGYALAVDLSRRSGKFDEVFLQNRVWPYIRTDRDGASVTERTIFALAERYGWIDPETIDAFDVIEEVTPKREGKFRPIPSDEFVSHSRPVTWLVKGVIPHAELVVVYGESGSGKSFFTLDLVAHVVQGLTWRTHKVRQHKVVYIAAEGATGFRNRLQAHREHHGSPIGSGLLVIPEAPRFTEADDIRELVKATREHRPGIIVVDTLSRVLAGADENSNEDMGRVVAHCSTLYKATGATVLLVHHSGKDATRGARGWSGLRAAADTEIEITRSEQDRIAVVTKQKDGEDGSEFGFRLNVVSLGQDEDGDPVTSCVVLPAEAVRKLPEPKGAKEKLVLEVMRDMMGLTEEDPAVNEVIEACVAQCQIEPGRRDRRREKVGNAIETLLTRGILRAENGRLTFAAGK